MNKIDKTDTLTKILSHRRFTVDVFQREYRWGRKQIEQMISDFQDTFEEFYDSNNHDTPLEVMNYGYYYMGCIICTGGSPNKIIDGQQRLTSLTLLLIYLNNLQKEQATQGFRSVQFDDMIYDDHFGTKSFNIDVDDRQLCLHALIGKAREFTVEYNDRSWPDALKYGFLSTNIDYTGKFLKNIQDSDIVYCHISGAGFVGIGECTAAAVPMKQFKVSVDGAEVPITDVPWVEPSYRAKLDVNKEIFIRVDWKSYVQNQLDGYWEKGMISVPLAAYQLSDQSTHKKVREHFGYKN